MKRIVEKTLNTWQTSESVMLITIISHSGSTPRGSGAQMLVGTNGLLAGTVGGGAVEREAIDLAIRALANGESFVKDFELNPHDTALNMVCGGAVKLHFLYVSRDVCGDVIGEIDRRLKADEHGFMVLDTANNTISCSNEVVVGQDIFSVVLPVPERVVIFGGGHVAQAVVPVLSKIGFGCIVVENREALADKTLFPTAKDVQLIDYERVEDYVALKPDDYYVVMTHGHSHDYVVLEQILRKSYTYVGVIGSRRKTATVNEKLRAAGIPEDVIESVHAPIGLAIGAVTPDEIAISIAAEMIRVRALNRGQTGEKVCPVSD